MSVLIEGVEMPTNCYDCWALDDYKDYLRCRITDEYCECTFPAAEKRMNKCPLIAVLRINWKPLDASFYPNCRIKIEEQK